MFRSLLIALLLWTTPALAQSTAQPVLPGFLTTTGCPSGSTVCYLPYSVTNPLPVTSSPIATGGITPVPSTAAESSRVFKASAGNLYAYQVTTGAAAGYVMIFNATSAPADGAVTPVKCVAVPARATVGVSNDPPEAFSTGITAVFSTTGCFTKTASATAMFSGDVK